MKDKIELYLTEIKKYLDAGTSRESMFEEIVKVYLLQDAFDYKEINLEQQPLQKNGEKPDFIIKIGKKKIPLEIKQFENKLKSNFKSGRLQVAKYTRNLKEEYCILTDTKRWEFIKVHPTFKKYKIIWSYQTDYNNKKESSDFLMCLRKGTLINFIKFADTTFGTFGFEKMLDISLMRSETEIKETLTEKNVKITKSFLRLLKSEIKNQALKKEGQVFIKSEWKNFA